MAGAGVGEVGNRRRRPSSSHLRCLPLDYPTHRDRDTDTDTDRDRDREVWERDGGEGWGCKVGQVCANRNDAASLPPHVAHAAQLADKRREGDRVSDDTLEQRRKVLGMCLYVLSMLPLCHHRFYVTSRQVLGMCLYVATASMSPLCHLSCHHRLYVFSHVTTTSTLSAPPAPPTHATSLRASSSPQTVHSSHETAGA